MLPLLIFFINSYYSVKTKVVAKTIGGIQLKYEENDLVEDVDIEEVERIDHEEEMDEETIHIEWAGYI
jgi:hypothetical protein